MKTGISCGEIAADLLHIHEDRARAYKLALRKWSAMPLDLKAIFERIIEESREYSNQLRKKTDPEIKHDGAIYQAWQGVKIIEGERKPVLAASADDQLAVLNIYSMALAAADGDPEIMDILVSQQEGVKKLHDHIRQYHDAQ